VDGVAAVSFFVVFLTVSVVSLIGSVLLLAVDPPLVGVVGAKELLLVPLAFSVVGLVSLIAVVGLLAVPVEGAAVILVSARNLALYIYRPECLTFTLMTTAMKATKSKVICCAFISMAKLLLIYL
jgi:hypothetical protein